MCSTLPPTPQTHMACLSTPTASASPGNLLEMQIFNLQNPAGEGEGVSEICVLTRPAGEKGLTVWEGIHSLRTTGYSEVSKTLKSINEKYKVGDFKNKNGWFVKIAESSPVAQEWLNLSKSYPTARASRSLKVERPTTPQAD